MINWLTNLFSTDTGAKAMDDILDKDDGLVAKAGGWFDRLSYTDEEKAEANQAMVGMINDFVLKTMGENSMRSKTRRRIAVMWIQVELFLIILSAAMAPFDMDLAQHYWNMATSTTMFTLTAGIGAFFFGGHLYSSHIKGGKVPPAT